MDELKLILTKEKWRKLGSDFTVNLSSKLTLRSLDGLKTEAGKARATKFNEDLIAFRKFIMDQTFNDEGEGMELIECDTSKTIKRIILERLEETNHPLLSDLFEANNLPFYYKIVKCLGNGNSKYKIKYRGITEEMYINVVRNLFLMVKPLTFQRYVVSYKEHYETAVKDIDFNEHSMDRFYEIEHKHFRQIDPLDNSNVESALWYLLQITDIPFRILDTIIKPIPTEDEAERFF